MKAVVLQRHARPAAAPRTSCHVAAGTKLPLGARPVTPSAAWRSHTSSTRSRNTHCVQAAPADREEQLASTVTALLSAQKLLLEQNQALISQQGKLIDKICAIIPEAAVSAAVVASAPPTPSPSTPAKASPAPAPSPPSPSPSATLITPPKPQPPPSPKQVASRGPGEKEERWVQGMPRTQVSAWEEAKAEADALAEMRAEWIRKQMQDNDKKQQAEQREKE